MLNTHKSEQLVDLILKEILQMLLKMQCNVSLCNTYIKEINLTAADRKIELMEEDMQESCCQPGTLRGFKSRFRTEKAMPKLTDIEPFSVATPSVQLLRTKESHGQKETATKCHFADK